MSAHQYLGIDMDLKDDAPYDDVSHLVEREIWDDTLLPLREVFMMVMMDKLTDKPNWHKKIFDEEIVAKWRREASELSERELFDEIVHRSRKSFPLQEEEQEDDGYGPDLVWGRTRSPTVPFPRFRIVSRASFEYCLNELRNKAAHFEATGVVPTLDSLGRAVVKSDSIVDESVKLELRAAFHQLYADQAASNSIDWHPGTDEMVQDLVHPSLYPFVYGRSPFIPEEVVGVEDSIDKWAGKGKTAPERPVLEEGYSTYSGEIPDWSLKYQWLPSNLEFKEDGSLRFTSYINNLHPQRYSHIYHTLEKLIGFALPVWDQVLLVEGRRNSRFSVPGYIDDRETDGLWEPLDQDVLSKSTLKPTLADLRDIAYDCEWNVDRNNVTEEDAAHHPADVAEWKWKQIRDAIFLEPDSDEKVSYSSSKTLRQLYKDPGLQVIVKLARIELTPESPEYAGGGWHVEGMKNESICATALYYLDSENITPSYLAFRTNTDRDQDELSYGQDAYNWLERWYGVDLNGDTCVQTYGRVETREGRMLAFPNTFQHRVSPFRLVDRTKPGHRSFVALWLVDPDLRIVSTANVPPQQAAWWSEAILGKSAKDAPAGHMPQEVIEQLLQEQGSREARTGESASNVPPLPQELINMVLKESRTVPLNVMSHDEALAHRLELMKERSQSTKDINEGVSAERYNFCEH